MTVNWRRFFLFLGVLLAKVDSIQNQYWKISGEPQCADPYSCMSTSECAERHSPRGTEEVLFLCDEKKKVCCPPAKIITSTVNLNKHEESEYNNEKECLFRSFCQEKKNSSQEEVEIEKPHRPEHHVHNHHNYNHESQRPYEPQEPRRPPPKQPNTLLPPTQRPQSSFGSEQLKPQDYLIPTQRPQGSQNPQPQPFRPQIYQKRPSQPFRPQSSQTTTQKYPVSRPSELLRPPVSENQKPQSSQNPQARPFRPEGSKVPIQRPDPTPIQSQETKPIVPTTFRPQQNYPPLTTHKNYRLLPTESNCGVNNFANRITEGEEVSLGEYPWMVLTGLKDKYGNYRWNCGGTLISGWYVLTAAHCLVVDNRTIEFVRLGEHSLTNETDCFKEVCLEPPEDVPIAEVIPHERWNTTTIKNDIALLRLSRNPLTLGKSNIYPICLPIDMEKLNITSSTKYEVAGWGKTDWNADEGSDVLRKASISGVNREDCNICKDKKKQQYCPIIDTQLCVQGWKSVDVCKGDSGGPLMVTRLNIYQIGITSFKGSEYCGAENIPSIFTRVESYMSWILDNIRE